MDRPAYSIHGWLSLTRPSFPYPLNSVGYRHVAALLQVFEIYTFPGCIIRGEHSGGSNNCIIQIYAEFRRAGAQRPTYNEAVKAAR